MANGAGGPPETEDQLAKRVFEIAKELGVKSKAVVEKCHHEGIPEDVIKGHMSTVSAGLEATIREWFSDHGGDGGTATAVETSEKVDLEEVKAKPRRRAKAKKKTEETADKAPEKAPGSEAASAAPEQPAASGKKSPAAAKRRAVKPDEPGEARATEPALPAVAGETATGSPGLEPAAGVSAGDTPA
ncbi:MAG TPA: hypothetical protein ENK11_00885, partial [Phycisphaerales bacterium]|nr:hypothetical protein [Phycisphaerales bacterium]